MHPISFVQSLGTTAKSVTGHHCSTFISSFCSPVFVHMDEIPLSVFFSKLTNRSSLGPSSHVVHSEPLINSTALCWSDSSLSMCLALGSPDWTQHSGCFPVILSRGEGSPALTHWLLLLKQSRRHDLLWISN